jgi:hypothetical protein
MPNFVKVNYAIVADIKKELRAQGHFLTGELEQSFVEKQSIDYLEAYAFAFLEDLEKGVQANNIPELNVNSKEFANLVYWVGQRGFRGNHFIIAKNIWKAWQREGKPLEGSKKHSSTGEVLHAVEIAFTRNEEKYFKEIDDQVITNIDKEFFRE